MEAAVPNVLAQLRTAIALDRVRVAARARATGDVLNATSAAFNREGDVIIISCPGGTTDSGEIENIKALAWRAGFHCSKISSAVRPEDIEAAEKLG